MLPINLDGPSNVLAGPSEAYKWAHSLSEQFFQLFQMGPVSILQDRPKHMHGPNCVLIDVANNFGWAQYFFNRTFRSLCVGPLISKAKLLIVSEGPVIF